MGSTLAPVGPARFFDSFLNNLEVASESLSPAHKAELQTLLKEKDPELFCEGLSILASRLERADKAESAALLYASVLHSLPKNADPVLRDRLQRRLSGIQGHGSFGSRFEFLLGRLAKDATDPKTILPMLLGTSVYSLTRSMALGRFGTSAIFRAIGPRIAASIIGFAAEVPTFALSARAMRPTSSQGPSMVEELEGAAITLGFLKIFGHVGQTLGAKSVFWSPSGFKNQFLSQTAMFGGLMTAHKVEEMLGLRPHIDGATTVTDTLASMFSLGIGASLAHRLLGSGYAVSQREWNARFDRFSNFSIPRTRAPETSRNWENPFFAPMLMSMGDGKGDGKFLPNLGGSSGVRETTSPESLRKFRRRCVEAVREEYEGSPEVQKHLKRLVHVFDLIEKAEANGDKKVLENAWEELRKTGEDIGIAFENEGVAEKSQHERLSRPPAPPVPPILNRKKGASKKAIERVQANAQELEIMQQRFLEDYQKVEDRLSPETQERYLQASRKAFLMAEASARKLDDLLRKNIPLEYEKLRKISLWQVQSHNEIQLLGDSLQDERLLELDDQGNSSQWVLRPYQVEIMEGLKSDMMSGEYPWLGIASPMQTGKSHLIGPIVQIMRNHFGPECRFLILSSARIITSQLLGDLMKGFPPSRLGRFDGMVKEPKEITVASIPSLARNLSKFPSQGPLVIINDEAYSTQSPSVGSIYRRFGFARKVGESHEAIEYWPSKGNGFVVGLSGTGAGLKGYKVSGQLSLLDAIQQGWIRQMLGEREFLSISSVETHSDGENMIWWKPTKPNAKILAEIFQRKIHGQYENSLIFVPTIRHAELLRSALDSKLGKGSTKIVHSQMEESSVEAEIGKWEKSKGPLVSVKKLSRGFRGTGVGAVFHTYQTGSSELYAQRTGRAWGLSKDRQYDPLYVLEATWNRGPSFANLARLLGLADYPDSRIFTENIDFEFAKTGAEKVEVEAAKNPKNESAESSFGNVPQVESWRHAFSDIIRQAGSIAELAEATGIPQETLSGYSLGALPMRRADLLGLREYLGGSQNAQDLWVRSWESAVDESIIGESVAPKLVEWRSSNFSLLEKSHELDGILANLLPSPQLEGRLALQKMARELSQGGLNPREAEKLVEESVSHYDKERHVPRSTIFRERIGAKEPLSRAALAVLTGRSRRDLEIFEGSVLKDFVATGLRPAIRDYLLKRDGGKPLEKLAFPDPILSALHKAGIHSFQQLVEQSSLDIMLISELGMKELALIKSGLWEEYGFKFSEDKSPEEKSEKISLDKLDLASSDKELLSSAGVSNLQEFLGLDLPSLLRIRNLNWEKVQKSQARIAHAFDLSFQPEGRAIPIRAMNWRGVPLGRLGVNAHVISLLKEIGIQDVHSLITSRPSELMAISGFDLSRLDELQNILEKFRLVFNREAYHYVCDTWSIDKLGLPKSMLQSLRQVDIHTLGDLSHLNDRTVWKNSGLQDADILTIKTHLEVNEWWLRSSYGRGVRDFLAFAEKKLKDNAGSDSRLGPAEGKPSFEDLDLSSESLSALRSAGILSLKDLSAESARTLFQKTSLPLSEIQRLRGALIRLRLWKREAAYFGLLEDFHIAPERLHFNRRELEILKMAGVRKLSDLDSKDLMVLLDSEGANLVELWGIEDKCQELGFRLYLRLPDTPKSYKWPLIKWAPSKTAYKRLSRDGIRTIEDLIEIPPLEIARRNYFSATQLQQMLSLTHKLRKIE